MAKKIVSAASLSRSEFDKFLKGSQASDSSKARYEREWKHNHVAPSAGAWTGTNGPRRNEASKGKRITEGRPALPGHGYRKAEGKRGSEGLKGTGIRNPAKPSERRETPKVTKKEVLTKKSVLTTKTIRYPIGRKRLEATYKDAKADFAKYSKATQARYWSAWQRYQLETGGHKDAPSYRIILSYRAKIDGHIMKDSEGKDIIYHWSTVLDKKRLSKKDLALEAEAIKVTTNVTVFDVKHVIAYDNWTGKQV